MAQRRQLERSTIETWFAISIGIVAAAIPMSWGWECALLAVAWLLICDIVLHTSSVASIWLPGKLWLCLSAFALLDAVSWPSIAQRYATDHPYQMPPSIFQFGDQIAAIIAKPGFVGLLLVISVVVILWGQPVVWRARHRAIFFLRRAVTDVVWISHASALEITMKSRWAQDRRFRGRMSGVGLAMMFGASREDKFSEWCELALRKFRSGASRAIREQDGKTEYNEASLREWLKDRYEADLIKEFGDP